MIFRTALTIRVGPCEKTYHWGVIMQHLYTLFIPGALAGLLALAGLSASLVRAEAQAPQRDGVKR